MFLKKFMQRLGSLPGRLDGEGEGERPAQREMGRPKKTGGESYQPIGILTEPATK
jgi:hypothetical protein